MTPSKSNPAARDAGGATGPSISLAAIRRDNTENPIPAQVFTKRKGEREVWSVEVFQGQGGATIFDLRLKRRNGLGELIPVQSGGAKIALIANIEHLPAIIQLLGQVFSAVKGGAQ